MSIEITDDEVYSSIEFRQYELILDEDAAFYYAREEILARRARERRLPPTLPPFKEWYREYLQSPEWRERADAAKARFGGRCALCNSAENLQAHHRTYDRVGEELPEDLTVLCSDCHGAYHEWQLGRSGTS